MQWQTMQRLSTPMAKAAMPQKGHYGASNERRSLLTFLLGYFQNQGLFMVSVLRRMTAHSLRTRGVRGAGRRRRGTGRGVVLASSSVRGVARRAARGPGRRGPAGRRVVPRRVVRYRGRRGARRRLLNLPRHEDQDRNEFMRQPEHGQCGVRCHGAELAYDCRSSTLRQAGHDRNDGCAVTSNQLC